MIFHLIFKTRSDIVASVSGLVDKLGEEGNPLKILLQVHELFKKGRFQHGRYLWITDVCGLTPRIAPTRRQTINVWGGEYDRFVDHVTHAQVATSQGTCTSQHCSRPTRIITRKVITLSTYSDNSDKSSVHDMMTEAWERSFTYCPYTDTRLTKRDKDGSKTRDEDGSNTKDKDGSKTRDKDGSNTKYKDGSKTRDKDGSNTKDKDGTKTRDKDGSKTRDKDGSKTRDKDGSKTRDKDGSKKRDKDGSKKRDKDGSKKRDKDGKDDNTDLKELEEKEKERIRCRGYRNITPWTFRHGPPPFLVINVEQVDMKAEDFSSDIYAENIQYKLFACTMSTGNHFVAYIFGWRDGSIIYYDGLADHPRLLKVKKMKIRGPSHIIYVRAEQEPPMNEDSTENPMMPAEETSVMELEFVTGDISEANVDVIVNAANKMLKHGGGVALALSQAAGRSFQKESDNLVKNRGPVPVGESVWTKSGLLKSKYVVHTVGPDKSELKQGGLPLLCKAFESALHAACTLKARTVAMPLLSAGIFGVDVNSSMDALSQVLTEFSRKETTIQKLQIWNDNADVIEELKRSLKSTD